MTNLDRKKGDKKAFKKLVAQYQREGYPSKEAKKYASEEMEELMDEKKFKSHKKERQ